MNLIRTIIGMLLCIASVHMETAMANDETMGFTYNGFNMSNATTSFGLRDKEYFLIMRGAPNVDEMPGAGFFVVHPDAGTKTKLTRLRSNVCALKDIPPLNPGNNAFLIPSVTCDDGRKIGAYLDFAGLGKDAEQFIGPPQEIIKSFFNNGEKVAKLDALIDVKPQAGKLLVTVKFVNSGRVDIAFKSPATWEGGYDPISANSYVSVGGGQASFTSSKNPGEAFFLPWFGGSAMINRTDYPDDVVRIPPGEARFAKFLVYPDDRFKSGRYRVGATLAIREMLEPSELAGKVEFGSEFSTVEFQADYPANQKELSELEAYRREQLSQDIHVVGGTVKESGYYRAFGENGERDDFPQSLVKGDKFPARQVENQTRNGRVAVAPATIWRWEAYPDAQMKALSNQRCPRSGMWVATIPNYNFTEYFSHILHTTQFPHSVEVDHRMPSLGLGNAEREAQVVWTWLGPKDA